jgi:amino acid adenylation domain-containing protein
MAVRISGDERSRIESSFASLVAVDRSFRDTQLWTEQVPYASTSPAGHHRTFTETHRAPSRRGAGLIVVRTDYVDDVSVLSVTARRSALDSGSMIRLVTTLTGDDPVSPPCLRRNGQVSPPAPAAQAGWWFGGVPTGAPDATLQLGELGGPSEQDTILALLLTLARYEDSTDVAAAVLSCPAVPHGPDTVANHVLAGTASGLESAIIDAGQRIPPVGLIFSHRREGITYDPCLLPPWPVTLWCERLASGQVLGECRYDARLVSAEAVSGFLRHFQRVLDNLPRLREPGRLDEFDPLSRRERMEVLRAGVSARAPVSAEQTIARAFRRVARDQPDAVAYVDERDRSTYGELARAAAAYAGTLRGLGVVRGGRVGICLDTGVDFVIACLAVLELGAAYVPMDPRHPVARLGYVRADAGLRLVITGRPDFPRVDGVAVAAPPARDRDLAEVPEPPVIDVGEPSDVAYVIYTSGSTGSPKGVLVPHRNVLALLEATRPDLELSTSDVWTWFHSSAFDFSVWEIWGCLLTGGRLVGVPFRTSRSTHDFYRLLERHEVTVLSQTPTAFRELVRVDGELRGLPAPPRLVVLGGESLDVSMLAPWFRRHAPSRSRVVNMFGITETTVHVTAQTVDPAMVVSGSRSVGRAIPGWEISVRDRAGRPVPFGVPGEVYVGGAGVARGYLDRAELTAERFTLDGFSGQRVYRSGDRGRLLPDGRLEHLGRFDSQVQLHGHRVELEEVRLALLGLRSVRAAAVTLSGGSGEDDGSARLEAFVVCRPRLPGAAVKRELRQVLPDYMVPAAVWPVPEIPMTLNGKADIEALRRAHRGGGPELPAAASVTWRVVDRVRQVWQEVFGGDAPGDGDDFFELGGNSLLAAQVVDGLAAVGFATVSVPDLYRNPSIAQLAACLAGGHGDGLSK